MVETKMFGKLLALKVFLVAAITFSFSGAIRAAEGDVWIVPVDQQVDADQNFDVEIRMNTGGKALGAFNLYFDFNSTNITVDITQGTEGWDKGADTPNYTIMANPTDIANGHYRVAGVNVSANAGDYANSGDAHLITIHAQSTSSFVSGASSLNLRISELSDDLGYPLSNSQITGNCVVRAETRVSLLDKCIKSILTNNSDNIDLNVNGDSVLDIRDLQTIINNILAG